MPAVRATKPDLDQEIPIALAARIAGIERAALSHLVDHGLVEHLDLDTVRSLALSGAVAAKPADSPRYLVVRTSLDPQDARIADMTDEQLAEAVAGPHRIPDHYAGHSALITVRGFVVATGQVRALGDPVTLRTDRRGREIRARSLSIAVEHRLHDLTARPSKAAGDARWLGRRARVRAGRAVLPLEA